jgi:cyclohexyl-isocyanide hydratase
MNIGILVFDRMTQLDATGPFEVLARIPGATVTLIAKRPRAVHAEHGLTLVPHADFEHCPRLDVLLIPGGAGIDNLLLDDAVLEFVRRRARTARYVTAVCTGSLVLAAAGLLQGRRAACHWLSLPLLAAFGAKPSRKRIEHDGKFITAGGVTAGIDFGLWLAAKLGGLTAAKEIQLSIQYDPEPPVRCGTPRQAGPRVVFAVARKSAAARHKRAIVVAEAASRLALAPKRKAP